MRKLSFKQKKRQIIRSLRIAKIKRLKKIRQLKSKEGNERKSEKISLYKNGKSYKGLAKTKITAPKILNLFSNWEETSKFLRIVRFNLNSEINQNKRGHSFYKKSKRKRFVAQKYYDFSSIEEISTPVALIIASEFDRFKQLTKLTPHAINIEKWNPKIRDKLNAIGFLELCGVDNQTTQTLKINDAMLLRMKRGSIVNSEGVNGEDVAMYLADLGINLTQEDPRLHEALMEAITNSVHHAYRNRKLLEKKFIAAWWLVAALKRMPNGERNLQLVVYDQGASIPATLPDWDKYPLVQRIFRRIISRFSPNPDPSDTEYDGMNIQIAIKVGKTSTANSGRGKGLDQILQPLKFCTSGRISIYSRSGVAMYEKDKKYQPISHETSITGTLISWNLTYRGTS